VSCVICIGVVSVYIQYNCDIYIHISGSARTRAQGVPPAVRVEGAAGRCHMPYVIVMELHKMCLFIYSPWTKSGLLTLITYTNNVFSFSGIWFILFYDIYIYTSQWGEETRVHFRFSDSHLTGRGHMPICNMYHNNRHNYTN
jgi:hypothetical protein